MERTPSQRTPIDFDVYRRSYAEVFPQAADEVSRWGDGLVEEFGKDLSLCHYIVHIRPRTEQATSWTVRDDFEEKFGQDFWTPPVT